MKRTMRWLASFGVIALVVVLGFAFAACGSGGSDSSAANTSDGEAAHVEGDEGTHDDDAAHVEDDELPDGDEALHVEGGEADGHDDAEANAYLEVAPKDALYLVKMTNFAFTPDVLEVDAGEILEIGIQNVEPILHDFTIDKIDADVHISYLEGTGQHAHATPAQPADVHFALTEPGTGVVHLKIHEPGEYVIYCTVPGHREAGMEGTLIVR